MSDSFNNAATPEIARRVLAAVDAGLSSGLGKPIPGQMCVEAAVCYAQGLPHSDRPTCVGESVRVFKIRLNDAKWSSNAARAAGMRKLAIAQLGSDTIDQKAFRRLVAKKTIRRIVPIALRAAAKKNPKDAEALEAAAVRCEIEGTQASARAARSVADAADAAAADAAAAAVDAAAGGDAAAAADAADAAAAAAAAAYDAVAAAAAAVAAAVAVAAAAGSRDAVLQVAADIGLEALIELKSPGAELLYLADEEPQS